MRKTFKIYPVEKTKSHQKKSAYSWYASGFNPNRDAKNNNFQIVMKQVSPRFDVRRLDNPRSRIGKGLEAIMTAYVIPPREDRRDRGQITERLTEKWRDVLIGNEPEFKIIGMEIWPKRAHIWVFHPEQQILFNLLFTAPSGVDDWYDRPIYHFPGSKAARIESLR